MVHFVGAGSGARDLITVRGERLLKEADVVIYAGSLVNPELLSETKKGCRIYNRPPSYGGSVDFRRGQGADGLSG